MTGSNFDIALNLNDHLRTRCQHMIKEQGESAPKQTKRKKTTRKQTDDTNLDADPSLFLRVSVVDARGRTIEPDRLPIDEIELLMD